MNKFAFALALASVSSAIEVDGEKMLQCLENMVDGFLIGECLDEDLGGE